MKLTRSGRMAALTIGVSLALTLVRLRRQLRL